MNSEKFNPFGFNNAITINGKVLQRVSKPGSTSTSTTDPFDGYLAEFILFDLPTDTPTDDEEVPVPIHMPVAGGERRVTGVIERSGDDLIVHTGDIEFEGATITEADEGHKKVSVGGSGQWFFWETDIAFDGTFSLYFGGSHYNNYMPIPCTASVTRAQAWFTDTIDEGSIDIYVKKVAPGDPCPDTSTYTNIGPKLTLNTGSGNNVVESVTGVDVATLGLLGVTMHVQEDFAPTWSGRLIVGLQLSGEYYDGVAH